MAFYHDIKISFILGIPCRNSNILCFNIEFIFSPRILESQVQFNRHIVYFNELVLFGGQEFICTYGDKGKSQHYILNRHKEGLKLYNNI